MKRTLLIACILLTACTATKRTYRPGVPELGSQAWHTYMADKAYLNRR